MTSITDRKVLELYCPICEQHFETGELCPEDGNRLVRLTNQIDPFLGRELDGRFSIVERIGHGGMGSVYRARQHSVSREIAIKVIHPGMVSDPTSIKRFLREAKIASRLAHPNIVAVMDFGQAKDGVFWLAMELVEGQTLQEVLAADGPFPLARLVRVAMQLLDALVAAHAIPIVHRDLKPANIMMLANSRDLVKILDFGLAKSLATDATSNTVTGSLLGTPAYMPPELANGETCDGRADLYSLGCILFVLGTGRPPFEADSVPEMIAMHGTLEAPPMTGVPDAIAAVVDRLLKKRPEDRFQTAADARAALEAAFEEARASGNLDDLRTSAYTPLPFAGPDSLASPQTTLVVRPPSRAVWWGVGGLAVIGIGIAIGIGAAGREDLPPAQPAAASRDVAPLDAPADAADDASDAELAPASDAADPYEFPPAYRPAPSHKLAAPVEKNAPAPPIDKRPAPAADKRPAPTPVEKKPPPPVPAGKKPPPF